MPRSEGPTVGTRAARSERIEASEKDTSTARGERAQALAKRCSAILAKAVVEIYHGGLARAHIH